MAWAMRVGLAAFCAAFLVGYTGYTDLNVSRHRAVATKTQTVTISGYDDQYQFYSICAYQQTRSATLSSPLGCTWPTTVGSFTDTCGRTWYRYSYNVTLLGSTEYWARDAAGVESTRVFVSRNQSNGGLYTASGDEASGKSDSGTCIDSRLRTNANIAPLTYYLGSVPSDLVCTNATRSAAACPYVCNRPEGCDASYGRILSPFYNAGFRSNYNFQDTSQTLFDHYGANTGSGTPPGNWSYQLESGICAGGTRTGLPCDNAGECPGGSCINQYYWTMRRNTYGYDSMNIRRGENRRNAFIEAWVKMKYSDTYNREIGLIQRWYNRDNYFGYSLTEYTFDVVKIYKYQAGVYSALAWGWPALNLTQWTKLGFKAVDLGSYASNGTWTPNGNCALEAQVGGNLATNIASTPCGFAPYGGFGPFTYFNSSAQFLELTAHACNTAGVCFK